MPYDPRVPWGPQFTLSNGKRVFFGEILSHDALLRVLKAYVAWRTLLEEHLPYAYMPHDPTITDDASLWPQGMWLERKLS